MSNLWFVWCLQECQRNCWELKLAIGHFRQPWLESLTLGCLDFDRTVFTLAWVDIEARSELVCVQVRLGYSKRRRARRKLVGAVRHWRRMPRAFAPCPPVFYLAASKDVDARCDDRLSDSEIKLGFNSPFRLTLLLVGRVPANPTSTIAPSVTKIAS